MDRSAGDILNNVAQYIPTSVDRSEGDMGNHVCLDVRLKPRYQIEPLMNLIRGFAESVWGEHTNFFMANPSALSRGPHLNRTYDFP